LKLLRMISWVTGLNDLQTQLSINSSSFSSKEFVKIASQISNHKQV
jgi:hypothetical protein